LDNMDRGFKRTNFLRVKCAVQYITVEVYDNSLLSYI
jgi:hypothetical protein